ncbi:uncharacterized protein zbtb48 [Genypterus blacodes]|uniref:uncharacterized protein zbtb48 n=1 Tax=Genypterus blacodes TaxID=154954 RepID=UPI003F759277
MPAAESNHAHRVLSFLNQQREAGRFCDAMLNVGGGVVYLVHRNILACFSELFQESSTPSAPCMEVYLQECPKDGLEMILNFVYTGELNLDPANLDQVQRAAASLCVPEALTLCRTFTESSVESEPLKRRRGRPKKSTSTTARSVKEDNLIIPAKHEVPAATVATTTTRSGRTVRGPRRLAGESPTHEPPSAEKASKWTLLIPTETESFDVIVESQNLHQPTDETEITQFHIDVNDNRVRQANEEQDEDEDFEAINEDSNEEYVPVAESSSAAPSTTQRDKTESKAEKKENGEAVEDDSKKGCVQCPTCGKSFRSKYYLKVHNRRHTGEKPFVCLKCGKRYFRKENLLEHESRNCSRLQTFSCLTCSATFNRKQDLRMHVISHTGDMPNKCSSCPEQFMHKKDLTNHMIKVHGFPKPHACVQCAKSFLTRTELRIHEAAKHRGEKPFVCEECGHRASSRNGLQMHIKAIHRNERPFVCSLCGHAFTQKTNLNMHLRVHTGERPFQCHLCGKTFRTQASLDKHHRTHTGERPFSCEFCEQRFTEKGPLVRHIASKHQEGRPHCCYICNKTFKAMEQLRVHLRRHKGMRKFECVDCGYKFTRQAHLRRHIQIHKRTENYNPRQRKLRNVIVEEVDGGPSEAQATKIADASAVTEDPASHPESVSVASLSSTVRVVIEASDTATEEAVAKQSLAHGEAVESFSVVSEDLQPTQLVTEAYESTVDMEGIVSNVSESKT